MAEFREVMMAAKRMCNSMTLCAKCPLDDGDSCITFDTTREYFNETVESKVMQWNKEHPVKTNADRFKEVFGVDVFSGTQHGCAGIACPLTHKCSECEYKDFWNKEYVKPREDDNG